MRNAIKLLFCCLLFLSYPASAITFRLTYTGIERPFKAIVAEVAVFYSDKSTPAAGWSPTVATAVGNYATTTSGGSDASWIANSPYYMRIHNSDAPGVSWWIGPVYYTGGGTMYFESDWDGPPPEPVEGQICFTNTFAQVTRVQIKTALGAVLADEVVSPGSSLCYSSNEPFFFNIIETTIDVQSGEPEEKTTFQWGWDGTSNQTTNLTSNTATPRKNPGSSNPLNPTPANDTQAGVNGIVNQLQDNRAGEAQDLAGLAGILEQIRDKVATNQPAGDTNAAIAGITSNVGSFSNQVQGAGLSASNSVHGELSGQLTGADGLGAAPSWSFTIGDMFIDANPFAVPEIETLRVTFRTFVLFLAKLLVLFYVWKEVQETMSKLAAVAKGSGTSGFLQAALLSVPQLVTTIAGLGIRWKVVLIAIPLVAGWVSKTVLGANAIPGVVATFAALAPTDGALLIGYQMFFHVIPLAGILSLFFIGVMAVLGLRLFLIVISVIVDVTSKA